MSSIVEAPPTAKPETSRTIAPIGEIPSHMKTAVYTAYGPPDVVQITEVETPLPKDAEVLIKVRAGALNPLDWRVMRGGAVIFRLLFGWKKPKPRPGRDVAGTVVAVGSKVKQLKPGDNVFGLCMGAFAEYACAGEAKVARKPDSMSFEQAASVPIAGITALQGLRDNGVRPGTKVLINGAAGGVGTFAVQVAKWLGAEVTGVCSTKNVEMVRSLGAGRVIDYTQEDFTKSAERYDVILDNVGNLPLSVYSRSLRPKGRVVMAGAPHDANAVFPRMLHALLLNAFHLSMSGRRPFRILVAKIGTRELSTMAELFETRTVVPVVEQCYSLNEITDALRYLETGHVKGKLVITFPA